MTYFDYDSDSFNYIIDEVKKELSIYPILKDNGWGHYEADELNYSNEDEINIYTESDENRLDLFIRAGFQILNGYMECDKIYCMYPIMSQSPSSKYNNINNFSESYTEAEIGHFTDEGDIVIDHKEASRIFNYLTSFEKIYADPQQISFKDYIDSIGGDE